MFPKSHAPQTVPTSGSLLTSGDVAQLLHVTPAGVRWMARHGRLAFELTPRGQRFYHRGDVLRLLGQRGDLATPSADPPPVPPIARSPRDTRVLSDNLARCYNLSVPEYDRAVVRQGGRCAVCGEPPKPGQRLSVDHDHETGQIRGLLCNGCNAALGCMRERPDLIYRLAAYAEQAARLRVTAIAVQAAREARRQRKEPAF